MTDTIDLAADPILNRGEPGIRRLQEFIEPYASWTGSNAPADHGVDALRESYDAQRGLDLSALAGFGDALAAQVDGAREQAGLQAAGADRVAAAWPQGAGVAATGLLSRVCARAQTDIEQLIDLAAAIDAAVTGIATSLRQKADTSRSVFGTLAIGGKQAHQVAEIVNYARGNFGLVDDGDGKRDLLRAVLPEVPDDADPRQYAADWLNRTFVPELDSRTVEFAELNRNTHIAVTQHYTELLAAFDGLDHSPYPTPEQAPTASAATISDTTPVGASPVSSGPAPAPDTSPHTVPGSGTPDDPAVPSDTPRRGIDTAHAVPPATHPHDADADSASGSFPAQSDPSPHIPPAAANNPAATSGADDMKADPGLRKSALNAHEIDSINSTVGNVAGTVDSMVDLATKVGEAPLNLIDHAEKTLDGAVDLVDKIATTVEEHLPGEHPPGEPPTPDEPHSAPPEDAPGEGANAGNGPSDSTHATPDDTRAPADGTANTPNDETDNAGRPDEATTDAPDDETRCAPHDPDDGNTTRATPPSGGAADPAGISPDRADSGETTPNTDETTAGADTDEQPDSTHSSPAAVSRPRHRTDSDDTEHHRSVDEHSSVNSSDADRESEGGGELPTTSGPLPPSAGELPTTSGPIPPEDGELPTTSGPLDQPGHR